MMSLVQVMMWQPTSSACTTLYTRVGWPRSAQLRDSRQAARQMRASSVYNRYRHRQCGRANTDTQLGAPPSLATLRTWSSTKIAVTLTLMPSCESRWTISTRPLLEKDSPNLCSRRSPQVAISRACSSISAISSENTSKEIGRSGISRQYLWQTRRNLLNFPARLIWEGLVKPSDKRMG